MMEEVLRMEHAERTRALALTALFLSGCAWGTSFYFGKMALGEMSVGQNVCGRFIFGTLAFAPILWRPFPRLSAYDRLLLGIAAFVGIPIQFLIQFKGLQLTTVSHAALMIGTLPVLLAISSAFALHERLRGLGWGALFASTAGAVLIATSSSAGKNPASLKGDLLVVVSMIAAVVMVLTSKHLVSRHDPLYITALTIAIGTVGLLLWVGATEGISVHHTGRGWVALLAQGLIATTAAFTLWNWGLSHLPASHAGIFLNLEPLVGTILGIVLLGDRLGATGYVGGVLIISSAVYFTRTA
jgi:drug/metabolite transporter (DMT)-like permease